MIIEKVLTSVDRTRVVGHGPLIIIFEQANVASKRMKICFCRKKFQSLVRERQRFLCFLFRKRLSAFVVEVVGRPGIHRLLHRELERIFTTESTRWQCRGCRAICVNTLLGWRVRSKQAAQPIGLATLTEPDESFLQRNRTCYIVAGSGHVLHAVAIRLKFSSTSVLHRDKLRRRTSATDRKITVVAVAGHYGSGKHQSLHDHATRNLLRCMSRGRVHNFVTQYRGEFCLRIQLRQQPPIDRDLAARQGPRVGYRVVEYDELIRELNATLRRDFRTYGSNVLSQRRVDIMQTALRLLHRYVTLLAHLQIRLRTNRHELAFAGYRIHRASGR